MGFAVVGCGRMGKRRAQAIYKNKDSNLICVVDNNHGCAKSLAKGLKCEYYTNYNRAIERNDIDAVVVSLPNKFHSEVSVKSMTLGKHVFCEKPLAITPEEAKLMVETALDNDVFLKAGSNVRFFENIEKARELIEKKAIGKLLFARGWVGHGGWNLKPDLWFTNPDLIGGGTMLDNGCHLIDIIRWFIGEIKECFGYSSTLLHELPIALEDNAVGILIGLKGEPAIIQSSWTEWNGYFYIEFYGENGALYIDSRGNEAKTIIKLKDSVPEVFDYSKEPKISFKKEIDDFISCILSNRQPLPSGYDGMRVIRIIYGLYESARSGRKISVYDITDHEFDKMIVSRRE